MASLFTVCSFTVTLQAAAKSKPRITAQPTDKTADLGSVVMFAIKAEGGSLRYQWYYSKDGGRTWTAVSASSGKTAAYQLTAQKRHDGYRYYCRVSNSKGSVKSAVITLKVSDGLPKITKQPKNCSAAVGKSASFSVTASGTKLTYQWYCSSDQGKTWKASTIASGKTATFTPKAKTTNNGNQYYCKVSNGKGAVSSKTVTLTTFSAPSILTQPKGEDRYLGEMASFSVKASGSDLHYVWYYSKDGGKTWDKTAAERGRSDTYTIEAIKRRSGYLYYCQISNGHGTVKSRTVELKVYPRIPEITEEPADLTAVLGETAVFSVKAAGKDLSYQWYYSKDGGQNWSVSTSASGKTNKYSVIAKGSNDGVLYKCVVSSAGEQAETRQVCLTVIAAPSITKQPNDVYEEHQEAAVFSAEVQGKEITAQWYYRTSPDAEWTACELEGAQETELTVRISSDLDLDTEYRLRVSNAAGSMDSDVVRIIKEEETAVTGFVRGGLKAETGEESPDVYSARSEFFYFDRVEVDWDASCGCTYQLIYLDKDYNLAGCTEVLSGSQTFDRADFPEARYFRFMFSHADPVRMPNEPALPENCSVVSNRGMLKVYHDQPQSQGVLNFLKRMEQGLNLEYTTANILPQQKGDIAEGTEMRGMVYSSSREEGLYVPNCVSFESFMTAMKNPNSYVYTRISNVNNSRTYYGNVCSGLLSYAYDLGRVSTSAEMPRLSAFKKRAEQDADHLALGDMMKKSGHVICVYDILRDSGGKIVIVRFAQQTNVTACVFGAPPAVTNEYLSTIYKAYEYTKINSIPYTESPWVSARGEEDKDPRWNHNLIPRRGDKANWPLGETVEIDIMEKEDYTTALLYRDGVLLQETPIEEISCLSYDGLDRGTYQVCLCNETDQSDFCYFKVVSSEIRVEDLGNGKARIFFSSEDGTPVWYSWNTDTDQEVEMYSYKTVNITSAMARNGQAVSTYKAGTWLFRVHFKNVYGVFSSQFVLKEITDENYES